MAPLEFIAIGGIEAVLLLSMLQLVKASTVAGVVGAVKSSNLAVSPSRNFGEL